MKRIIVGVLAAFIALFLAATLAPAQATAPEGNSFVVAGNGDTAGKARACDSLPDRGVPSNERHVDLKGCRASDTTFNVRVHVWPHWKNKPVRLHFLKNGKWTVIRKRNTNGKGWTTFAAVSKKGSYKVSVPAKGDYKRSESQGFRIF